MTENSTTLNSKHSLTKVLTGNIYMPACLHSVYRKEIFSDSKSQLVCMLTILLLIFEIFITMKYLLVIDVFFFADATGMIAGFVTTCRRCWFNRGTGDRL